MRRLPPLNALKTFECAARHGGMQSAAVELCVTPAAVRQQVRSLERYLGLPLFRRVRGGLALPHEGEVYLREARVALDRLASATEQLMEKRVAGTLRVSVIPSFCSHWLVPRLSAFVELYPEVVLRLIEDIRTVDFSRDRVDMALRYGRGGGYAGLRADRFMDERLHVVAAPVLVARAGLERPSDLARVPLLHEADERLNEPWSTWGPWLETLGIVRDVAADRGLRFNNTATLLAATMGGRGVAIGRRRLIARDLNGGRLVTLFGLERSSRLAYWIVSPPDTALLPRVQAFRGWLQGEAEAAGAGPVCSRIGGRVSANGSNG